MSLMRRRFGAGRADAIVALHATTAAAIAAARRVLLAPIDERYPGTGRPQRAGSSPYFDQSSGFGSVYSPMTLPSTASICTRPRIVGGSSALYRRMRHT